MAGSDWVMGYCRVPAAVAAAVVCLLWLLLLAGVASIASFITIRGALNWRDDPTFSAKVFHDRVWAAKKQNHRPGFDHISWAAQLHSWRGDCVLIAHRTSWGNRKEKDKPKKTVQIIWTQQRDTSLSCHVKMTATAIVIAQSRWIISTLFLKDYLADRSLNIASDPRMLCGSLTIATDIREPRGWPVNHLCPLAASSIFE